MLSRQLYISRTQKMYSIHLSNSNYMLDIGMSDPMSLLTTSVYWTTSMTLITWISPLRLLKLMTFSYLTHLWLTFHCLFVFARTKARHNFPSGALLARLPRPYIVLCNSLCFRHQLVCTLIPWLNCHHTQSISFCILLL